MSARRPFWIPAAPEEIRKGHLISDDLGFVVAGAGIPVAKHGNRSVSSLSGSADVLGALGVKVDAPKERVEQCIAKIGIGFLFAPLLHEAMKYAVSRDATSASARFSIFSDP